MNKIMNFLVEINLTLNCFYIKLFKIFLIGITSINNEIGSSTSLTIQIYKLRFTFIFGVNKDNILSGHGIS